MCPEALYACLELSVLCSIIIWAQPELRESLVLPMFLLNWNTWLQNEELELMYKTCYARILDSKRRFIQAATQFYELSQTGQREVAGKQVVAGSAA